MMAAVRIDVARVRGTCNAGLAVGDSFLLRGLQINPEGHGKACPLALYSVMMNVGRLFLEGSPIFVSCPDPGTGAGGNVLLGLQVAEP